MNAWTFKGCESLASVTIPANMIHISSTAFLDCNNLKDVYYEGSEAKLSRGIPMSSVLFMLFKEKPVIHFGMK